MHAALSLSKEMRGVEANLPSVSEHHWTYCPGLSEEMPDRKKRRRPQVDYKALDEKLKAQEIQIMQTN